MFQILKQFLQPKIILLILGKKPNNPVLSHSNFEVHNLLQINENRIIINKILYNSSVELEL